MATLNEGVLRQMTVLSIDSNAICFKSRLCGGVHQKIGTMYANLNDDKALWM